MYVHAHIYGISFYKGIHRDGLVLVVGGTGWV